MRTNDFALRLLIIATNRVDNLPKIIVMKLHVIIDERYVRYYRLLKYMYERYISINKIMYKYMYKKYISINKIMYTYMYEKYISINKLCYIIYYICMVLYTLPILCA